MSDDRRSRRPPRCPDRGCRIPTPGRPADAGAALPAERGRAVPGGIAGPWRRLGQQGPHRQRFHRQGVGRERHPGRLDRFPHAARGPLPRLARRHQSRHPLAEGARRRIPQPRRLGRQLSAHRAAGIRYCWRRCGPTTRAMRRCGWPTPRRSTPSSAFVISGWGVLDPLLRYELAEEGRQRRAARKPP